MKKILTCICLALVMLPAFTEAKNIVVTNALALQRTELIEIPWSQVQGAYPGQGTTGFKVINALTKKEYPYQLEYKGSAQVQNLLVLLSIPAKGTIKLALVKGKPLAVAPKTFCRFVPERKDDFAWENDRIAFRTYGKALENTPNEMAYGIDVWVKRVDTLVVNARYKRGQYHVDNGDGMDYYHVGRTLGAGGVAPYVHDTIWFPKNYRTWKVLDNGPLRSTFELGYESWTVDGKAVTSTKIVSLDAGSQLNRSEVKFEVNDAKPMTLAVGIIKRPEAGEMLLNEKGGILGYWEPQHGVDGTTGVGCVLTTPVSKMAVDKEHLLAATVADKNNTITYYHGACWDKAGKIKTAAEWFNYLQVFATRVKSPLTISIQ